MLFEQTVLPTRAVHCCRNKLPIGRKPSQNSNPTVSPFYRNRRPRSFSLLPSAHFRWQTLSKPQVMKWSLVLWQHQISLLTPEIHPAFVASLTKPYPEQKGLPLYCRPQLVHE